MSSQASMRAAWAVMALLAVAIAGYAVRGMVSPSARPSFMADLFARAPLLMVFHLRGGSAALTIGAVQVNRRIKSRFLVLHQWLGAGYAVAVLLAGTAALALAPSSFGGMVTHLGFGGLGVCWLATTILAVRSILRLDIPAHRGWMYRSYALTLAEAPFCDKQGTKRDTLSVRGVEASSRDFYGDARQSGRHRPQRLRANPTLL